MRTNSTLVIHTSFYIICALTTVLCLSCGEAQDEERKSQWIMNEVNHKIQEFKAERKAECISQIIEAASSEVDSILSQKDIFSNIMDKEIPNRPIKPEYVPLDTNAITNHKVERVLN